MTTYLTIITTILVATQVIRITQNAISLYRMGTVEKRDLEVQKAVFYMMHEWLKKELHVEGK